MFGSSAIESKWWPSLNAWAGRGRKTIQLVYIVVKVRSNCCNCFILSFPVSIPFRIPPSKRVSINNLNHSYLFSLFTTDNLGQFLYFLENVKSLEHRSVALQWHRVKAASYISYATTQKGMTMVLWHQSYLYQ